MYCINIYYIGKAYFYFRKTGGIKGDRRTTMLPEEKLAAKGKNLANKAGDYIENKVDQV